MHILEAALAANAPRYSFSPTAKDTTPMEPPHGGWRMAGAVLAGMLLLLVTGMGIASPATGHLPVTSSLSLSCAYVYAPQPGTGADGTRDLHICRNESRPEDGQAYRAG
jgi:hypothetical protein